MDPLLDGAMATTTDDTVLSHSSYNTSASTTIVLIHGAFSSRREWDLVVPLLSRDFHLLIPDLPGHVSSSHLSFSVTSSAAHLATLIRHRAHNRTAHVIGFSLGSHVALALATTYPELVDVLFVSGFAIFPRTLLHPVMPWVVWLMVRLENAMPRPVVRWLMDGTDIRRTQTRFCTLKLCREVFAPLTQTAWPQPWPARTLVVAAVKQGILPTNDSVEDAKRLASIGRASGGNSQTSAYEHELMRHPWNRQDPVLCAETARAWFENERMPAGFHKI